MSQIFKVVDIETNALDFDNIAEAMRTVQILAIGIMTLDENLQQIGYKDYHGAYNMEECRQDLLGGDIIAHNGKFDTYILNKRLGLNLRTKYDTMIMAYLVAPYEKQYGLKRLALSKLGVPDWDVSLDMKTQVSPEMLTYLNLDVKYTAALFRLFIRGLTAKERGYVRMLSKVDYFYYVGTIRGVKIDLKRAEKEKAAILGESQRIERWFNKVYRVNPGSAKQLGDLMYTRFDLPIVARTKSGAPGTGKEAIKKLLELEGLTDEQRLVLTRVSSYNKKATLLTNFIKGWLNSEGLQHPKFNLTTTVSGRTSSSKPNFQNLPRGDIRQVLVAPKGYTFVEIDYSQVELRAIAHIANIKNMKAAFNAGEDLHEATARMITGKDKVTKAERSNAKTANFGLLYGMSANGRIVDGISQGGYRNLCFNQYDIHITEAEAVETRTAFFRAYPELTAYYQKCDHLLRTRGELTNPLGRRFKIPHGKVPGEYNLSGRNAVVQGFASDLMLLALYHIEQEVNLAEVQVIGTVHDACIMYVKDNANLVANLKQVKAIMENVVELSVPLIADVDVWVDSWYGTHHAAQKEFDD